MRHLPPLPGLGGARSPGRSQSSGQVGGWKTGGGCSRWPARLLRGGCTVPAAHLDACFTPGLQKEEGAQRAGLLPEYVCCCGGRGRWAWTLTTPVPYSAPGQSKCGNMEFPEIRAAIVTLVGTSHSNRVFPKPCFPYGVGRGDRDRSCQDGMAGKAQDSVGGPQSPPSLSMNQWVRQHLKMGANILSYK